MKPANQLTALQALSAIDNGTLTSEALTRACLDRIEERNPDVLAFTTIDPALALQHARAADRAAAAPLRGLPFAVKDVIDTAQHTTAYGSPIYVGHRPVADAACVASARERGAFVLGKVATSEFATQTPSTTRNPHRLEHTPGGSSSGSAAAVADFMVPVAFGTQTTASTVRPASYCGVVGYKPTFGFFNAAGLKPLSPGQDTISVLTRTVEDAALFSFGLHGVRLTQSAALRPRLAVCMSKQWEHARPEMVEAIEQLAAQARRDGAHVVRIQLPEDIEALVEMQARLFAFEARQSLAHERAHHSAHFSTRLQQRLAGGEGITPQEYLDMRQRAALARQAVQALFADVDGLLYPPAEGEADKGLKDSGSPRFGALWSLLHLPCISLPIARGPQGLPMGTQVIGAYGDDERLMAVAAFVSQAARPRWEL
ncbi:amidase [Acidovorax sp. SRB_14]|uniref:amidase n=1 Tax=Acidovorax sp. SRB_14 TaxID=1962699 RepID=UPI001566B98C|nr:amidase [Acidovorax sp. SRB_14]NMM82000.1 amidase [Acidovorax sp. SRB_14]